MRCGHCGKNEATRTYEQIKNGKKSVEYYCMSCYDRLFLNAEKAEGEESLSACPYCGMTAEEFRAGKLVGCAYCYRTLKSAVLPVAVKMQGEKTHTGKTPPLPFEEEQGVDEAFHAARRAQAVAEARLERQCNELETIIAKLQKENNYQDAKSYADKLSSMRSNSVVEEDFVWRTRRNLSKRS